ncbi:hypothetical protein UFOVP754_33 [uncultured Caudovirales phage]|uniref:Uncharacterized protein n=1 Tax=uncultured Caudovirales phage TaxID=2100421 RepID=A0A6J7X8V1_9CAUD|nr:hypothetical protein UFOVP754_33 [uncultured Caudovirales phage]
MKIAGEMNKYYLRFLSDLSGESPAVIAGYFSGKRVFKSKVPAIQQAIKKAAEIALDGKTQSDGKHNDFPVAQIL